MSDQAVFELRRGKTNKRRVAVQTSDTDACRDIRIFLNVKEYKDQETIQSGPSITLQTEVEKNKNQALVQR